MAWKEEQPFHLDVLMRNIAVQIFKAKYWAIVPISLYKKKLLVEKLVSLGFKIKEHLSSACSGSHEPLGVLFLWNKIDSLNYLGGKIKRIS